MVRLVLLVLALSAPPASAEVLAARTLSAGTVIGPDDLLVSADDAAGAAGAMIGLQTRTIIYAGREVTPAQLGQPLLVTRNQMVVLAYESGALSIRAEGRALAAGAEGEVIRVMNLASRTTVEATIRRDGVLIVAAR